MRRLHIVQPKLVVIMGAEALAFLNGLEFPLALRSRTSPASCSASRRRSGRWSSRTSTSRSTSNPAKTRFWQSVQGARRLVGGTAALTDAGCASRKPLARSAMREDPKGGRFAAASERSSVTPYGACGCGRGQRCSRCCSPTRAALAAAEPADLARRRVRRLRADPDRVRADLARAAAAPRRAAADRGRVRRPGDHRGDRGGSR